LCSLFKDHLKPTIAALIVLKRWVSRRVSLDAPGVRVARGFAGVQNEPRL